VGGKKNRRQKGPQPDIWTKKGGAGPFCWRGGGGKREVLGGGMGKRKGGRLATLFSVKRLCLALRKGKLTKTKGPNCRTMLPRYVGGSLDQERKERGGKRLRIHGGRRGGGFLPRGVFAWRKKRGKRRVPAYRKEGKIHGLSW